MNLIHGCVKRVSGGEMIIRLINGREIIMPCQKGLTYGDPVKVSWNHHSNSACGVYTMEEIRKETQYTPDEAALREKEETVEENFPFLEHEEL